MSLSYTKQITVKLAKDSGFTELLLQRKDLVRADTFEEHVAQTVKIAGSGSHTADLSELTVGRMLYLEASGAVDVKLNGSATAIPVEVDAAGNETHLWLDRTAITALVVENNGAATVTVTYVVAGD